MKPFIVPLVLFMLLGSGVAFATGTSETPASESGAEMVSDGTYQEAPMWRRW